MIASQRIIVNSTHSQERKRIMPFDTSLKKMPALLALSKNGQRKPERKMLS
jgi:hypothetical protein